MALEPVKYGAFGSEIESAWQGVVRGGEEWVVLSARGDGELEPRVGDGFGAFLGEFGDQVAYGLARVTPPGSDVEKLLLVGWCPDTAPMKARASFAANFGTVANNVLKGYHVQVTARDEDDLDEQELLMKISNAAGARYSIQAQPSATPKAAPPKAAPKAAPKATPKAAPKAIATPAKTSATPATPATPAASANAKNGGDDDDWSEPELKERDFDSEPLKPNQSTFKPIGKVDLQKHIAEEAAKEDPRLVNKIDPASDIKHLKEQSKMQRDSEMNKFIGGTKPPMGSTQFKDDDKVIKGFKNEKTPAQLWAEKKAKQQGNAPAEKPAAEVSKSNAEDEDDEDDKQEDIKDIKSKFESLSTNSEPPIIQPRKIVQRTTEPEIEAPSMKKDPKKFGNPLPGMHSEEPEPEADEDNDDDWDDDEEESKPAQRSLPPLPSRDQEKDASPAPILPSRSVDKEDSPAPPSLPSRAKEEEQEQEEEEEEQEQEQEEEEEAPAPSLPTRETNAVPPPPPRRATEEKKEEKPWATAEYDYEAAEDNELTFEENDKIINIEFVDDDWWLGELEKTGEKGLFPSNYVSLGNQ